MIHKLSMKTACVLVTYNRAHLLKRSIHNILNQTKKVDYLIIVNNASRDRTFLYLNQIEEQHKNVIIIHSKINMGGAGGFYTGMKYALKKEVDWLWIMDDDCIPNQDALEQLLDFPLFSKKEILNKVSFLYSCVNWKNDDKHLASIPKIVKNWNKYNQKYPYIFEIETAMFNSLLINKKVIQKVGLPIKEFFIWYDDYEYTQRLRKELPGFYNGRSIVHHHTPENKKNNFMYLTSENKWKYQYGIRNHIATLLHTKEWGFFWALGAFLYHIKNMLSVKKNILFLPNMLYWAIWGFFFRYKKYLKSSL